MEELSRFLERFFGAARVAIVVFVLLALAVAILAGLS